MLLFLCRPRVCQHQERRFALKLFFFFFKFSHVSQFHFPQFGLMLCIRSISPSVGAAETPALHMQPPSTPFYSSCSLCACVCECVFRGPLPRPPRLNMEQPGDRYFSISRGAQIGWRRGHRRPSSNATAASRAT